jgi:catalase
MQSVIGGTVQKAGEAISGALSSNKKLADMQPNVREPNAKDPLTSEFGVKQRSHDIWLQASTAERQGPQLLEDNFAREKVYIFDAPVAIMFYADTVAF